MRFLAESETRFFVREVSFLVEFVRDGAGNVTEFIIHQGTRQDRLKRIK